MVSLIAVVAFIGLVVAGSDAFLHQSAGTVDSVKLHQIAADAAAVQHYAQYDGASSRNYDAIKDSAERLGYTFVDPDETSAFQACMQVSRGSEDNPVLVVVCR